MDHPLSDLTCLRITLAGRDLWLFSDGTLLPVVSGGSDAGPAEAAVEAPPADAAGDVSGDAEDADLSPDEFDAALGRLEATPNARPETLAEVKRLRKQAARQREQVGAYAAFDRFHPDDKTFLLETVDALLTNPAAATQNMAVLLQTLWGDNLPTVLEQLGLTPKQAAAVERKADQAQEPADDEPDLSDPRALAEFVQQQIADGMSRAQAEAAAHAEHDRQVDAKVSEIHSRLSALGFTDPRSQGARLVLSAAEREFDFDIERAFRELTKMGFKLQPATNPAVAEATTRQAGAEAQAGPPGASGQGKPRPTMDELIRQAEASINDRLDRQGFPAAT